MRLFCCAPLFFFAASAIGLAGAQTPAEPAQAKPPVAAPSGTVGPIEREQAAAPTVPAHDAAPEPPYASDPKFQKALAQAKEPRQTSPDRLDNWKHANKVAQGQCLPCMRQMIKLQVDLGAFKDAVATTQQMEAVATLPKDRLYAIAQRGGALLLYNNGQPKPEQLAQADAAFKTVLVESPNSRDVMFAEGRVLAMQGRNDEAKAQFAHYVDVTPARDKLRMRAVRFSDDPHLATLPMAPAFRMITNSGEELQLDDMNGKVVLLDFWATWCGPCKESLPEIARIAKQYANDPMVVVISVSQDSNQAAWSDFIAKNSMTWPQYRDADRALSKAYSVSAIPHFYTIDTNGVLKTEQVGANADVRGVVADLVKKAHKAEAKRAAATDKAGGL